MVAHGRGVRPQGSLRAAENLAGSERRQCLAQNSNTISANELRVCQEVLPWYITIKNPSETWPGPYAQPSQVARDLQIAWNYWATICGIIPSLVDQNSSSSLLGPMDMILQDWLAYGHDRALLIDVERPPPLSPPHKGEGQCSSRLDVRGFNHSEGSDSAEEALPLPLVGRG